MKKWLIRMLVLALLTLLVGGCGGASEKAPSSAPEVAVSSGLPEWSTTTTTEKATPTENLPSYSTTYRCHTTRSTTCRCPLTSQTTTTTDWGSVTVGRTYPPTPFTVGATVRVRDESFEQDFSGQVITSKAQLDALDLNEEHNAEEYTDDYFADKALVVLEIRLTSGSIQLRVDNVWASGNTMWVRYTTLRPNPFTNDMAYHRILLEISQKDADGIEHIAGEQVPIQLPSGSPPNPTAL